ncbi:hypothetical protein Q3G72_013753 [Acer saccharum]|nr:hypothetical protein Q3G72_013753 [Acer saccharum]
MEINNNHQNPHAIIVAYPLQGHVIPCVHLAMKLASKGFTITFVNTHSIHNQIIEATSNQTAHDHDIFSDALKSGLDIRYKTVSDGFPLEFDRSLNHDQFMAGLLYVFSAHVDQIVGDIVRNSDPQVSCLIADTFFVWSSMISKKYNLINISFWTEPALVFNLYYHWDLLRAHGHYGSIDNREDTIDYIPGVRAIEPKDLMSYIQATDTSTIVHKLISKAFEEVKMADFIICNTVQELEPATLSALQEKQPTYAIGPIFPTGFAKSPVATSLWSESECTQWLHNKPPKSVLYVSFGSYAHASKNDIVEIAEGLLLSEVSFIWVLRPDIVSSDETEFLPVGFEENIKDNCQSCVAQAMVVCMMHIGVSFEDFDELLNGFKGTIHVIASHPVARLYERNTPTPNCNSEQKTPESADQALPPLPSISQNLYTENNAQTSAKLKLQLFPIDDGTRRALEMDNHNPHLELTLSTRKKISSVLEHLNRKWGNSSVASGELMIFPYSVQREDLMGYRRWTQDSIASAADVYAMIGSPPLFCLSNEFESATLQAPLAPCYIPGVQNTNEGNRKDQIMNAMIISVSSTSDQSDKLVDSYNDQPTLNNENHAPSISDVPNEMSRYITAPKSSLVEASDSAANVSWHRKETGGEAITGQLQDSSDMRSSNDTALSAGEWADSPTNISVGDLLSEVPHDTDAPPGADYQCLQQIPFSCDSFDAAIAAHISRHQNKMGVLSTLQSHSSSIWDAEETCDAFSFQKNQIYHQEVSRLPDAAPSEACKQVTRASSVGSGGFAEELPYTDGCTDYHAREDPMDERFFDPHNLDNSVKDFTGLTDIYWPDSLGPLDLDIPSSKYRSEDQILGDSLGGLNRLIASSLDAFQNCSFFGFDKKEPTSTVEARETSSLSDFKIGSQG